MPVDHNIGFVCSGKSWGGLEMNVHRAAIWLGERGITVHIIAHPNSPLCEQATRSSLPCHPYSSIGKKKSLAAGSTISRLSKEYGLDTIVVHNRSDLPAAVLAKKMFGSTFKLIYQQHMQLGGDKRDLLHNWLYRHVDAWIAPLQLHADMVKSHTKLDPAKIVVIPFGVDLDSLKDGMPSQAAARQTLDLPESETIVGIVGRIDPKKGQDTLSEAVRVLHENDHRVHTLIVGAKTVDEATEFERKLYRIVQESGLAEFVHFRPHLENVAVAFAAMDMFALTSHSETYGLVTIEAMACGLPVIGTDSGGTPELIDHQVNGLLLPPRDPQALAESILLILKDRKLRDKLSSSAATMVKEKYSHTIQIDRFVALLEKL